MFKKKSLLILGTFCLLTSCGNSSTPLPLPEDEKPVVPEDKPVETPQKVDPIKTTLDEGRKGFYFETTYIHGYNGKNTVGLTLSGARSDNSFFAKSFNEGDVVPSKDDKAPIFETYYPDKEGFLTCTRLNPNNELSYFKLIDPRPGAHQGEYIKFENGYKNFFFLLNESDFVLISNKNDESKYSLNVEKLSKEAKEAFTTQVFRNPGLELQEATFIMEGETLKRIESKMTYETTDTYDFSTQVVSLGSESTFLERSVPFAPTTDKVFDEKISALKNNVFVSELRNNGNLSGKVWSSGKGVHIELYDELGDVLQSYGYAELSDKSIQYVEKRGNTFWKVDAPDATITIKDVEKELLPTFALSGACFDKTNSGYKMKPQVDDGDFMSVSKLENVAESLDDFNVTFTDTNTTFKNVWGKRTSEVTYTNIGTATLPYDINSINQLAPAKTFSETLTPEVKTKLLSDLNNDQELFDKIPLMPEGIQTGMFNVEMAGEPGLSMITSDSLASTQELVTKCQSALKAAGFAVQKGGLLGSGFDAFKFTGTKDTIIIEPCLFGEAFVIAITLLSNIA